MGCRVYIGHLASRASERDVEHFFRGYGRIRDVVLKNGFGFVEFDDSRDAEDAVYELNGRDLMGERVIVELSRRAPRSGPRFGGGYGGPPPPRNSRYGPPVQTRHRLVVENLSTRCSWQDLKDLMRHAGEVTYADAHKTERNTAVVCFATREDLKRAIEKYQGKDINGRKIKLVDDSQGGGRSYSRSHSRSRSPRSRSRSRSGGSRSRSRSRSPRSRSRSRSRSHSRSASRSRSPVANGKANGANSRSRSHTRSASRSRSRSRSGSNAD